MLQRKVGYGASRDTEPEEFENRQKAKWHMERFGSKMKSAKLETAGKHLYQAELMNKHDEDPVEKHYWEQGVTPSEGVYSGPGKWAFR